MLLLLSEPTKVVYRADAPDNFALLHDNTVLKIDDVLCEEPPRISGTVMVLSGSLYSFDYHSSGHLHIGYYKERGLYRHNVKPLTKCLGIPSVGDEFIVFPYASSKIHV